MNAEVFGIFAQFSLLLFLFATPFVDRTPTTIVDAKEVVDAQKASKLANAKANVRVVTQILQFCAAVDKTVKNCENIEKL